MIIRCFHQFQEKSRCRIEPLVVPCLSRFHRKLSATNRPPMRLPGNMCRYRQLLPQNITIRNIRDLISPRRHRYNVLFSCLATPRRGRKEPNRIFSISISTNRMLHQAPNLLQQFVHRTSTQQPLLLAVFQGSK